jgi:hypothetical protein
MTTTDLTPEELAAGWHQTEWTYIGRRMSRANKVVHFFLDANGETRSFAKVASSPVVGGVYLVEWLDNGDTISARIQSARYLRLTDDDNLAAWRLKDRAASTEQEAERARKRAAAENGDFGAMTLADVRAMMSRTVTSAQRAGTIAAVLNYIARGG